MRLCISDQTLVSNHRSCKIVNNNINTIFINEGFILRHESNLIVCIQVRFWIFVIKIYFLSFFLFDILLIFLEINFLIKIFVVVPLITELRMSISSFSILKLLVMTWRKLLTSFFFISSFGCGKLTLFFFLLWKLVISKIIDLSSISSKKIYYQIFV